MFESSLKTQFCGRLRDSKKRTTTTILYRRKSADRDGEHAENASFKPRTGPKFQLESRTAVANSHSEVP